MQHLRANAVEHGEADIGAILGRVDVDAERPLTERRADDIDDRLGDEPDIGILRHDRRKRLLHLLAKALLGTGLVFRRARRIGGAAGMGEVIGA